MRGFSLSLAIKAEMETHIHTYTRTEAMLYPPSQQVLKERSSILVRNVFTFKSMAKSKYVYYILNKFIQLSLRYGYSG